MAKKLKSFLALVALSILAAGLFGALHNQLSYTVGPTYFHDLKFGQFGIADDLQNRLGASVVGWRASWWMGLIVGLPAFVIGFAMFDDERSYFGTGVGCIFIVVMVTLLASMGGLVFGLIWADSPIVEVVPLPVGMTDRMDFVRAGLMHDMSYLGGLVGAVLSIVVMWRVAKAAAKAKRQAHATSR